MISKDDDTGARSASQSVLFCFLLLFISRDSRVFEAWSARAILRSSLILNGLFIFVAMRFLRTQQAIRRAPTFSHLDRLSAFAPGRARPYQNMKTETAVLPVRSPALEKRHRLENYARSRFRSLTAAMLFWLRQVQVNHSPTVRCRPRQPFQNSN